MKYYHLELLRKYPHLSMEESRYAYIDFTKTAFYVRDRLALTKIDKHLGILRLDELKNLPKEDNMGSYIPYKAYQLFLNSDFKKLRLDLVSFFYLGSAWYCSERLKNAIEEANIIGFDIVDTNEVIVE